MSALNETSFIATGPLPLSLLLTPDEARRYLVIPNFFSPAHSEELLSAAHRILTDFPLDEHPKTRFTTGVDNHVGDDWFLTSGDKIRTFFEESAFDAEGRLTVPKEQAINKIGHDLHSLSPPFKRFTLENEDLKALARDLGFHRDPLVLQSMVVGLTGSVD
jgi:phytanoyl-CoA hydroxylase